ncbi:MAG: hypothetical protein ABFR31_06240 [Thermodesulfobacteriota bacterium]
MSDKSKEEDSLISHNEIDKLLNSSSMEEAKGKLSSEESDSGEEFGELSQDDIDTLMHSNTFDSVEEAEADDEDDMELISQDDIDNLMNSNILDSKEDETSLDGVKYVEEKKTSKENIEELTESAAQDNRKEDGSFIEESEAVDVQECLVTQETIDDLINIFDDAPEPSSNEPVMLNEESASYSEEEIEPENEEVADSCDKEKGIPSGTTSEDFLKPDSNAKMFDLEDDEEDITQEKIDALLLNYDDYEDDDLLVTQDDIDTLLMVAEQEDEDVLGNLTDYDSDDALDDEEYEETDTESKSRWYKSKFVTACAFALIAMGIIVPAAYFLFFQGDSGQTQNTVEQYAVEGLREIEIETVNIHIKGEGDINRAGNMLLKNFVILASDLSKEIAYITTDVSIDYSDQRAYHEIQNNLSFYRDLIYDSIKKSLASGENDQITEADIIWKVETTLKKVLPGNYIDRISFQSFRAS